MNAKSKRPTRPIHLIASVFLLAALGVLVWQIYLVMVTPPEIEAAPQGTEETQQTPSEEDTDASTPQIQQLKTMEAIDPSSLGGDENHVYFRDDAGINYCEINKSLADIAQNEWLDVYAKDGEVPSGPGVVCNQVRFAAPHEADRQSCTDSQYSGGVAAVWEDGVGYGICKWSKAIPVVNDAWNTLSGTHTKAMDSAQQISMGQAVRLGDFICGLPKDAMVCVNAKNGKGFSIGMLEYETFEGVSNDK